MMLSSVAVFGLFAVCVAYSPDGAYPPAGSQYIRNPNGNNDAILNDLLFETEILLERAQVAIQRIGTLKDGTSDIFMLADDFFGVGVEDINNEFDQQNEIFASLDQKLNLAKGLSGDVARLERQSQGIRATLNRAQAIGANASGLANSLIQNISTTNENIIEVADQGSRLQARLNNLLQSTDSISTNISSQIFRVKQFNTTLDFNIAQTYQLNLTLKSGVAKANLPFSRIARNTAIFTTGFSFDRSGKRYNNLGNETLSYLISDDSPHNGTVQFSAYDLSQGGFRTSSVYASGIATAFLDGDFDIERPFEGQGS